jgi:uncharacterized membrane protein YkgB
LLTLNQKHRRAASSVEFVEMTDDDRNVLKRIVTGDDWCFMYNPETKRQSVTWFSPKKPKVQKVRMQKSWLENTFTAFSYANGIIHTNL